MTPLLPEVLATGAVSGLFFPLSSLKLYLEKACSGGRFSAVGNLFYVLPRGNTGGKCK